MTSRVTRAATARAAAAASLPSPEKEDVQAKVAPRRQAASAPKSQLSSPPATPSPVKNSRASRGKFEPDRQVAPNIKPAVRAPASNRKRKRAAAIIQVEDINELPHNLGRLPSAAVEDVARDPGESAPKRVRGAKSTPKLTGAELKSSVKDEPSLVKDEAGAAKVEPKDEAVAAATEELAEASDSASPAKGRKGGGDGGSRKTKANPYGLTPGQTPFPDWPHPTPEECQEINDLLAAAHGEVKAPATIPAPSTTVSGCGEVPSILDALIRTLLSAATTGTNSSRAFKGLVERFGLLEGGVGKGSVNWDRVRQADPKDVFEAIKSGGLAATKSKRIKEILDMVHQENIARRNALVKANDGGDHDVVEPPGAENESGQEKEAEIARADQHVLSLDHLHSLSSDEALNALIKYPGIGPKTASCVLLFCMQRPSFAVDTHVFRLCCWLNWVPPKATRNSTYAHCEVRVPDQLKYPLHQLMIRHGKTCPRCRAATGTTSDGWEDGCPIDHLVKRTGKRKDGTLKRTKMQKQMKKKKKKESRKDQNVTDDDDDDETESDGESIKEGSEDEGDEASGDESTTKNGDA